MICLNFGRVFVPPLKFLDAFGIALAAKMVQRIRDSGELDAGLCV